MLLRHLNIQSDTEIILYFAFNLVLLIKIMLSLLSSTHTRLQSKEKMSKGVRRGCVRLKGAVVGIDDQDMTTFTITVDHKTFHFQVRLRRFFYSSSINITSLRPMTRTRGSCGYDDSKTRSCDTRRDYAVRTGTWDPFTITFRAQNEAIF